MKFQAFHVNPGEKLKKKDVNNDLSHFMSVFPNLHLGTYRHSSGIGEATILTHRELRNLLTFPAAQNSKILSMQKKLPT